MPPADIALFQGEIAKAKRYIEFGYGSSTLYASQLGIDTISVENDRFYARAVASQLCGQSVRQILSEMGITGEWGVPVFPNVEKARSYVTAPWDDKPFPQFIPVDGGYRVACALESARRAKIACLCIGGANV